MSELSDHARALLDATREGDDPSAADRARVRRRVQLAIAVAAGSATAASAAPAIATQAGAAGAAGAQLAAGAQAAVATTVSAKIGVAVTVAVIGVTSSAVVVHEPAAPASEVAKVSVQARAKRRHRAQLAKPKATVEHQAEPGPVEVVVPAHLPEPQASSPAIAKQRGVKIKAGALEPVTPVVALAPSLEGELELLSAAQVALRDGDELGALDLLDAHASRFPNGVLALERDAVRIIALCTAGRLDDGLARKQASASSLVSSPLASRIDKACKR